MADDLPEGQMLFSLKEVSDYLKISISSLHRWRRDGELSARKVGKQWRVPRDELSRLAGSSVVASTDERLVMPDEAHGVRRPWTSLLESAEMVEFVEQKILKLALAPADDAQMRSLLEGLTLAELQYYRSALIRIISLADGVRETKRSELARPKDDGGQ
jgi:excisionase family DNA binding protein